MQDIFLVFLSFYQFGFYNSNILQGTVFVLALTGGNGCNFIDYFQSLYNLPKNGIILVQVRYATQGGVYFSLLSRDLSF